MKTKISLIVKRVLCSLLVFVIVFTAVSMVSSVVIFKIIYPRYEGCDAFTLRYEDVDAAAYPRAHVSFSSGSNELSGYLYPAPAPEALVVIAAGLGDGCESHMAETMIFRDLGYSVLCYDATGVGESEGGGVVGLSQPAVDLGAALDWAAGEPELGGLPVLLYAHSAGGYGAALCCREYEQVKAAVIISAFDSPVRLMHESARQRVGLLADIEYPFMALENLRIFGERADISAADCLKNCEIPVLIVEGSEDALIPSDLRLSARKGEIENPCVSCLVISEAPRSGHSGMWLSKAAAQYRLDCAERNETPDALLANRLDGDFMAAVTDLYDRALADD